MEAVAQVCDAHLTNNFKLGQNHTGSEIIDILREVGCPRFRSIVNVSN